MPGVDDFESRLEYALRFYYDAFEAYDLVLYPIQYASPLGETNPVEIIRISPVDATARNRLPSEVRELMGSRLHHFAGFLDSTWRKHDMVWGRLHGAECLIRALAPRASVPALVDQAHDRILRDYAAELGESPDPTPLGWFAARASSQTPSPPLAGTLKRATPVIATILTDILNARAGILSSVWAALRSALPDKPGGIYAVVAMLVGLAKIRPRLRAALLVLPVIIAVGVGLVVAPLDYGWTILGTVLLSGAATVTISLVALLWLVASSVRSTVTSRVQTFVNPS